MRFGQARIVEDFSKDSLEIVIQRIADLKAEAAIMAKGKGKGDDEQMG